MFCLPEGYKQNLNNDFWDDTTWWDRENSQREVYEYAAQVAGNVKAKLIVDVGCGSAIKLIRYFGHLKTVGVDLPPTVEYLKKEYPHRCWTTDLAELVSEPDLLISADCLEHIPNPDPMMESIAKSGAKHIILSTPDRSLRAEKDSPPLGPPAHRPHVREWSFEEFAAYVGQYFEIVEHFISNREQANQCLLCKPGRG